jgi:O-antigen/teichoic acid export membrane protein
MKIAKTVGQNTAWQIASKAINGISGLIIIGIISRTFGSVGVGQYTLILSYIGFYFIPVDFGLNAIAVKHLLDNGKDPRHVFRNLLGIRITIGLIATIIAVAVAALLPYDAQKNLGYSQQVKLGIALLSATILAQAILATTNAFFQSKHNYKFSFVANAVSAIFNTILVLLLVSSNQSFLVTISSFSLAGLTGAAVAVYLVKVNLKTVRPLMHQQYWKELITETLPLTTSLIINLIYFRVDSLLLPLFRDITEVGRYNVAYKVFDNLLVIPNYFANAIYPILLAKKQEGYQPFILLIKKSALYLAAFAIAISICSILLAPLAVKIITGFEEPNTIQYIQILSAGLITFFISSIIMWSLIVIGKQKALTLIYGTTMIINLILNLLLIPVYGALASAYLTIATEIMVLILSTYVFIKANK